MTTHTPDSIPATATDPALLAVLSNRFDAIVREMTNTLLRSGRSAVLNMARDFSCTIVTGDNRLLAAAEGLPVHVFGSHLQSQSMTELHPDFAEGDAYLHNDPYLGNTHHADHTILVPVFVDGRHLFTAVSKAHQADAGNSLPTTYMPFAKDVYEEGALSFPCVKVQSGYRDVDDVIRMCRRRIRVPDQWYGDYLATLGAARIAERRLKELAAKYGPEVLEAFVEDWFDYSERRMAGALSKVPSGRYVGTGTHDPIPAVPDGIPVKVIVEVDSHAERVTVDLRDNIDCVPAGLNQSEATSINNVVTGLFNVLDSDIPHNAGTFRRIEVLLRPNCVVGIPQHPTCCSMATTNVADRLINATQSAFAEIGDGWGLAEGGNAMGIGWGVISGPDWRRGGAPYVNQLIVGSNGGPAGPQSDGWLTWALPCAGGLLYRDSVEVDEQKYPIHIESLTVVQDGGGAGEHRGAPPARIVYGPRHDPMMVAYAADGQVNPTRGARGGLGGHASYAAVLNLDTGVEEELPTLGQREVTTRERVVGIDAGGGGYGSPLRRDPSRVLHDVREGWVSRSAAETVYGVRFTGDAADDTLAVDVAGTAAARAAEG